MAFRIVSLRFAPERLVSLCCVSTLVCWAKAADRKHKFNAIDLEIVVCMVVFLVALSGTRANGMDRDGKAVSGWKRLSLLVAGWFDQS
jgi:hypothetical protein